MFDQFLFYSNFKISRLWETLVLNYLLEYINFLYSHLALFREWRWLILLSKRNQNKIKITNIIQKMLNNHLKKKSSEMYNKTSQKNAVEPSESKVIGRLWSVKYIL